MVYGAVTAFCGVFAAVYEHFSHGMFSAWMVYLFAWPLVGGVLPYAVAVIRRPSWVDASVLMAWARLGHHAAVATATVGSCLAGVFEIYGTSSSWVVVYWIAAGSFALAALVLALVATAGQMRMPQQM